MLEVPRGLWAKSVVFGHRSAIDVAGKAGGELARRQLEAPHGVGLVQPLRCHEPRRQPAGKCRERSDPGHHQHDSDDAALKGHEIEVTIPDRRDRCDRPPQSITCRANAAVVDRLLKVQYGDAAGEENDYQNEQHGQWSALRTVTEQHFRNDPRSASGPEHSQDAEHSAGPPW